MFICLTSNSLTSSDYALVLTSLIAVGGVIIGALLAFLSQIIINSIEKKRELKRITYEKQIDVYPMALQYIMLFAEIQNRIHARDDSNELEQLKKQERIEFDKFFYIFSLITSEKKIKQFDNLKDAIEKEGMSPTEARERLQKILTFKKYMD